MRFYSFVNYYLSPLQHGLQTAHCVSEMAKNVTLAATINPNGLTDGARIGSYAKYFEWADEHKTIIICNGGNSLMLQVLFEKLIALGAKLALPVVKFHEDEQSLNFALTSVAILVPEEFYSIEFWPGEGNCRELSSYIGATTYFKYGSPEYELIELLKSHKLA